MHQAVEQKLCTFRAPGEDLGALGWAEMGLLAQGWVRACSTTSAAGAAQGHQGLTPSQITISKLQTPSPQRWQVANESSTSEKIG